MSVKSGRYGPSDVDVELAASTKAETEDTGKGLVLASALGRSIKNMLSSARIFTCDAKFDETKPCSLSFKDITKEVTLPSGKKYPILHKVSGSVSPGEMLAVMGMSGCGKTTLLQIISGRMTDGVTGSLFVQGVPFDKVIRSHVSYVWQDDMFYQSPTFTVRDQLMFTAYVQMPHQLSHENICKAVDAMLATMSLTHCADSSLELISGGERRRTSIAKELLTDPRLLFIDEGTSGLDSAAAFYLLSKLKALAVDNKIPVVMSIHQPSTRAFHMFDTVLMMSEGQCIYRGPPKALMSYVLGFQFNVQKLDDHNPADYVIDVLFCEEVDQATQLWPRYALMQAWLAREEQNEAAAPRQNKSVPGEVQQFDAEMPVEPATSHVEEETKSVQILEYQSSYYRQFYANFIRSFKACTRTQFGMVNLIQNAFMAIFVGLVWYQISNEEKSISDFSGYLYFVIAYWFFAGMFEGMLEFIPERGTIRRELVSGDYRLSSYFLAKTLAGTPVKIILPWLFVTISYFMVAKDCDVRTYFAFSAIVVLSTLVGNSIGIFIGALTVDYSKATGLTTVTALSMLIVGGFYIQSLPGWIDRLSNLSVFRFAYRASVQTAYTYIDTVDCNGGLYMYGCFGKDHVSGDDAVAFILGDDVDSLGINILVLFIYFVSFRFFAYLALLYAEYDTLFKEL